jgi:hypothetical protein
MKLTVEQFADAAAKVHTLRELVEVARTGRPDMGAMAMWHFTEQQFFEALALAIALSFSTN